MKKLSKYIHPYAKESLKDLINITPKNIIEREFTDLEPIKLKTKLTPYQKKFLPALLWLIGTGPRRGGRTTLLAIALLSLSKREHGHWIHCIDHTEWFLGRNIQTQKVLFDTVIEMAEKNDIRIEINHTRFMFRVIQ